MKLTEDSEKLIKLLCSEGYKAYAVGGCVRDSILNLPVHDIDICTSASPQTVEEILSRNSVKYVETGIKHGTVTAVLNHTPYEITTFRTDGEYLDNRRPESVTFVSDVESDLARRDFTVNAMAYNPEEGIVDLFGGIKDIENRVIRAVGNPDERFNEDALRIMRALRFSAVLGFEIEEETKRAVFGNRNLILNIAGERIFTELIKLLNGDYCENVLLEYKEVLAVVIPELKPCFDFPQHSKWHIYDVYTHTVKSVAIAPKHGCIRLALLFHDSGKPQCKTTDENGNDHFFGHPEVSAEIAASVLKRLKVSNSVYNKTVTLIKNHDYRISIKPSNIKKWLRILGEETLLDLLDLKIADLKTHNLVFAQAEIDNLRLIKEKAVEVINSGEPYRISDLKLNGNDLIKIGFSGKEIQTELEALVNTVSGNPDCNTREKLLKYAEHDYNILKEEK